MEQTAKITCDGIDSFYFEHDFQNGYQNALKQYEKLKDSKKYRNIQLFIKNRGHVGKRWLLVKICLNCVGR